jgi:hypothetical protein
MPGCDASPANATNERSDGTNRSCTLKSWLPVLLGYGLPQAAGEQAAYRADRNHPCRGRINGSDFFDDPCKYDWTDFVAGKRSGHKYPEHPSRAKLLNERFRKLTRGIDFLEATPDRRRQIASPLESVISIHRSMKMAVYRVAPFQSLPEICTICPAVVPLATASASSAVNCSTLAEMFMEQNFGPHIEQKAASLKPSSGSVSS